MRREGGQEEMAGDGGGSQEQMSVRDLKKWTLKTTERRGTKGEGAISRRPKTREEKECTLVYSQAQFHRRQQRQKS